MLGPKKVVLDGRHRPVQPGKFLPGPGKEARRSTGRRETPVAMVKGSSSLKVPRLRQLQGRGKLRLQKPEHTHAVFQLGVVLIKGVLRDGEAGLEVKLVGTKENGAAACFPTAPGKKPPPVRTVSRARVRVKGRQGRESRPVAGQAHGDDGHAPHLGGRAFRGPPWFFAAPRRR